MPAPGDAITWQEAAAILGVGIRKIGVLVAQGELSRGPRWAHRQLSRARWSRWRCTAGTPRKAGPDSYWLGTKGAAQMLGVNRARVRSKYSSTVNG
jgi:hypothetical protein